MVSSTDYIHELVCPVQNYDWGIKGEDSLTSKIYSLNSGNSIVPSKPYAELWMGTHPNGPATVKLPNGGQKPLKEVIGKDLPFLFKILSVGQALSIQAHPDKELAARLHREFPALYKDSNHKPEIAIALTPFEALCGFRPVSEIIKYLSEYPEFAELIPGEVRQQLSDGNTGSLRIFFRCLMNADPALVKEQASKLFDRVDTDNELQRLFATLNKDYPLELEPGQCIFMAANEPHAYLRGECVECMALSDNVVRAGLTPKFRDVDTLSSMLTYHTCSASEVLTKPEQLSKSSSIYKAPVEEFAVVKTELRQGMQEKINNKHETIFLLLQGKVDLTSGTATRTYSAGSILLISAENECDIVASAESALFFQAFQP